MSSIHIVLLYDSCALGIPKHDQLKTKQEGCMTQGCINYFSLVYVSTCLLVFLSTYLLVYLLTCLLVFSFTHVLFNIPTTTTNPSIDRRS